MRFNFLKLNFSKLKTIKIKVVVAGRDQISNMGNHNTINNTGSGRQWLSVEQKEFMLQEIVRLEKENYELRARLNNK